MPSVDLVIPQYILMARLHLTNSLQGLVLIYSSENLPFSIFLLRGFFEAIPKELEESFRLEGAEHAPRAHAPDRAAVDPGARDRRHVHVQLRLGGVRDRADADQQPVALDAADRRSTSSSASTRPQWGPLFAGSVIATVPSILVYLISQRWFRRGVSVGGIR